MGCRGWRRLYPDSGPCRICGREPHLGETGACRLCTKQAYVLRPRRHALDLEGANRHGQQQYFADTERRLQLLNPKSSRRRPEPAPQPLPPLVAAGHRQLALFPPRGAGPAVRPGARLPRRRRTRGRGGAEGRGRRLRAIPQAGVLHCLGPGPRAACPAEHPGHARRPVPGVRRPVAAGPDPPGQAPVEAARPDRHARRRPHPEHRPLAPRAHRRPSRTDGR